MDKAESDVAAFEALADAVGIAQAEAWRLAVDLMTALRVASDTERKARVERILDRAWDRVERRREATVA